jgi:hypothetical protein
MRDPVGNHFALEQADVDLFDEAMCMRICGYAKRIGSYQRIVAA